MLGREVGGCDLSKAHAVGLLPDLRQPQPLLHLAVPGAGQGGQLGRGSLGPSRPTWSPGPTCGRLASCAARRGARAAASPASRAAAPATCRTCAQSRPSARSPPGEGGLGSSSGSHGPGLPPAPAPLRSVRGMPWRPLHPRIQLGSSFRKDPSRAPSAPQCDPPCPTSSPSAGLAGLQPGADRPLLQTPSPSVHGTRLLSARRPTLSPHLLRAALPPPRFISLSPLATSTASSPLSLCSAPRTPCILTSVRLPIATRPQPDWRSHRVGLSSDRVTAVPRGQRAPNAVAGWVPGKPYCTG